jgi:hypothetical protein
MTAPSEAVQAKAATILLEGRVKVKHLAAGYPGEGPHFMAHVSPTEPGDPYIVRFNASGWHCDCPARVQICAHVLACQTITDLEMPAGKPALAHDPEIDKILGVDL